MGRKAGAGRRLRRGCHLIDGPSDRYHELGAIGNPDALPASGASGDALPVTVRLPSQRKRATAVLEHVVRAAAAEWHRQRRSANPDGIGANAANPAPLSTIVSLADGAFEVDSDNYATLLVYVGSATAGATIPTRLTQGETGAINGVSPVTVEALGAEIPTFSVMQTTGGYTILDLTQFNNTSSTNYFAFNPDQPLSLIIRNTLPNTALFSCSGQTVPFSTAEYTNEDSQGGGLMGAYVPLVDYPAFTGVGTNVQSEAQMAATLPSEASCGLFPVPGHLVPNPGVTSGLVPWPTYWPTSSQAPAGFGPLSCPVAGTNGTPSTPVITFAATQREMPAAGCGSSCTNITAQSDQTTGGEASPGQPPPLPVAIVGSGFGYLQQILPFAGQASSLTGPGGVSLLRITDCPQNATCPTQTAYNWETATTQSCQVYIASWSASEIWLGLNLPVDSTNVYLQPQPLSPLSDLSTMTFFLSTGIPANTMACPVNSTDQLTFTIGNPQSGVTTQLQTTVNPS